YRVGLRPARCQGWPGRRTARAFPQFPETGIKAAGWAAPVQSSTWWSGSRPRTHTLDDERGAPHSPGLLLGKRFPGGYSLSQAMKFAAVRLVYSGIFTPLSAMSGST